MPNCWGLVFFLFLVGCAANPNKEDEINIQWENGQPTTIKILLTSIGNITLDSIKQNLAIKLDLSKQAILGQYGIDGNYVLFRPLLPFTRGLKYEIWYTKKFIGELIIPIENNAITPKLIAIYPGIDSIPENLLKLHIEFSRPMEEGAAMKNIIVIRNGVDTIPSPFLDLEQELWNKEGNMLTLWLDPGRIKRDLQPNLLLGPPLKKGNRYKIAIKKEWRDRNGQALEKDFDKIYTVGERDNKSPAVSGWTLYSPKAHTKLPLKVWLNEYLDHVLLQHAVHITNEEGQIINGAITIDKTGNILYFSPAKEWQAGQYELEAESRLEDLAGNNLERLFDEEMTKKKENSPKTYRKSFLITK